MKTTTVCALLLGVLCAGVVAGSWYPRREAAGSPTDGSGVLYYVDPMHPSYTSARPGVAPDCGMPLRAVFAERNGVAASAATEGSTGALRIDARQQRLAGVRVVAVETAAISDRLHLTGRVVADESRTFQVNAGIDGFVREVSTLTTGSFAAKDAWLASISAPEARPAIQAYLVAADVVERANRGGEAPAAAAFANGALQQAVDRLLTIGLSNAQVDAIARTRQIPLTISIAAPAAGFVIARSVTVGQKIQRGDPLYRLADLRRVWVLADVPASDAERLTRAAAVDVVAPGRRQVLRGRLSADVPAQSEGGTQSVRVRVDVDNSTLALRPDMFVDVDAAMSLGAAITVPADAIVDTGLRRWVFVERGAEMFEPRAVEIGWRAAGRVEVINGLNAADRVVGGGAFLLDAENRLRAMPAVAAR